MVEENGGAVCGVEVGTTVHLDWSHIDQGVGVGAPSSMVVPEGEGEGIRNPVVVVVAVQMKE